MQSITLTKEQRELLTMLAQTVHEARLPNGARISDAGDFKEWLEELLRKDALELS